MFISRKAHDLIVAELRNQIAELKNERDYYRRQWTKSHGKAFARPGEEPQLPLFDRPKRAEEPLGAAPLDAGWTEDDRDLFRRWAYELPAGVDAEEEWRRLYGERAPLLALTV